MPRVLTVAILRTAFSVERALLFPPARSITDWDAAQRIGLATAPPAPEATAAERSPPPRSPAPAFARGAFVELAGGTATADFPLGTAVRAGAGFLFDTKRDHLRLGLSLHGSRVWLCGIAGLGFSFAVEDGGDYFATDVGAAVLLGGGARITVQGRSSLGFEAHTTAAYLPVRSGTISLAATLVFAYRFGTRPAR